MNPLSRSAVLAVLFFVALPTAAQTVYPINATADPGDGNCIVVECTLREAITTANANPNTLDVGNDAALLVALNGNETPLTGLAITTCGSAVCGLVIDQFSGNGPGYGMLLDPGVNPTVSKWIGVNPTDTLNQTNSRGGLYLVSAGNTIGGTVPGARNVLSEYGIARVYVARLDAGGVKRSRRLVVAH